MDAQSIVGIHARRLFDLGLVGHEGADGLVKAIAGALNIDVLGVVRDPSGSTKLDGGRSWTTG